MKSSVSSRFRQLPRDAPLSQFLSMHDSQGRGFITRLDRSPISAKRCVSRRFLSISMLICCQTRIRKGLCTEHVSPTFCCRIFLGHRPQGPALASASIAEVGGPCYPGCSHHRCHFRPHPLHHHTILLLRMSPTRLLRFPRLRNCHSKATSLPVHAEQKRARGATHGAVVEDGHACREPRTPLLERGCYAVR